jgi:AcrR family transcriptional regulator
VQPRARETREAITNAAGHVFGRAGFANAALADICSSAGITIGALYFHFGSKETLARAVLSAYNAEMHAFCDALLRRPGSPLESMIYAGLAWGRRIVADPVVAGGVRLSIERGDLWATSIDAWDPWFDTMCTLLARARAVGETSDQVEAESAVSFLLGAFAGAEILSREYSQHQDLEQRVMNLWHYSLIGLLPRSGDSEVEAIIDRVRRQVETLHSPPLRRGRTA